MDAVINRIIEIEKQSAKDVERAEVAYRKNIETHRRTLEEEKERVHARIISTENERLTQALQKLNKQTKEASLASASDFETHFSNKAFVEAVKEKIVAILLK